MMRVRSLCVAAVAAVALVGSLLGYVPWVPPAGAVPGPKVVGFVPSRVGELGASVGGVLSPVVGVPPTPADSGAGVVPAGGLIPLDPRSASTGVVPSVVTPRKAAGVPVGFDAARSAEVAGKRDAFTSVYANADGSETAVVSETKVNFRDGSGVWQKIDPSLMLDLAAGVLRNRAGALGVEIPVSVKAGGSLVRARWDSGHSVGFAMEGAGVPSGVLVGAAKVGLSNVLPGVGVEFESVNDGVKNWLVLNAKSSPDRFVFPVDLQGVSARVTAGGDVEFVDETGKVLGGIRKGWMVDSAVVAHSPRGEVSLGVDFSIGVAANGKPAVVVQLDRVWLDDPARVFPVRVDPTVVAWGPDADDTFVREFGTAANRATLGQLEIGAATTSIFGVGLNRGETYIHFSGLDSIVALKPKIDSASLVLRQSYSYSCAERGFGVYRVTQAWGGTTMTGFPGATTGEQIAWTQDTKGYSAACPENNTTLNVTAAVNNWVNDSANYPNYGVSIRVDDVSKNDVYAYKEFNAYERGNGPSLWVTYHTHSAQITPTFTYPAPAEDLSGLANLMITNTGSTTWVPGQTNVSYHINQVTTSGAVIPVVYDGARTTLPGIVQPGQTVSLAANLFPTPKLVDFPNTASWEYVYDLVDEGVAWFRGDDTSMAQAHDIFYTNISPNSAILSGVSDGASISTATPTLTATGSDPNNDALRFKFRVCTDSTAATQWSRQSWTQFAGCFDSPWIINGTASASWSIPANSLFWSRPYYWSVFTGDLRNGSTLTDFGSGVWSFIATVPVVSPVWKIGRDPNIEASGGVNTANGNFFLPSSDVLVTSVGPQLGVTRSYNSLDTRADSGFGRGYTSPYEIRLELASGGRTLVNADGRREFFGTNPDSSIAAPFGLTEKLTVVSGSWEVAFTDRTKYAFDGNGALIGVTDSDGRTLTVVPRNGAPVQSFVDAKSGRALTLTWAVQAGNSYAHVVSVATQAVTGVGVLQWNYFYSNDNLVKVCDPRNNASTGVCTVYGYDGQNRLTSIRKPSGNNVFVVAYDAAGKVSGQDNGAGQHWGYTYVASALTVGVTVLDRTTVWDPKAKSATYDYDSEKRLRQKALPGAQTQKWEFDASGFLTKFTDENAKTVEYTNDDRGNVVTKKDQLGAAWTYTYSAGTSFLLTETPPAPAGTITYTVDLVSGRRLKESHPATHDWAAGAVFTQYTYSDTATAVNPAVGTGLVPPALLIQKANGQGEITTYDYDSKGDLRRMTDPAGLVMSYTYDELGRKLTETTAYIAQTGVGPAAVAAKTAMTTYTYDFVGRVASVTSPASLNSVTGVSHQLKISTVYDDAVVRTANPYSIVTSTVSDLVGGDTARVTTKWLDGLDREYRTVDPEGSVVSQTFDAVGNVATVTDAKGTVFANTYDDRSMPLTKTISGFADDPRIPGVTRSIQLSAFEYDPAGRRRAEIDARGKRKEFTYDDTGRLLTTTFKNYNPLSGAPVDVVLERLAYDAAGRIVQRKTDNDTTVVNYSVDAAGWTYGESLVNTGSTNRDTVFGFDKAGRPLNTIVSGGGRTETTQVVVDKMGRDVQKTVFNTPNPNIVTLTPRDERGAVKSSTDANGNTSWIVTDIAGKQSFVYTPATTIENVAGTTITGSLVSTVGFNTFGERTHLKDGRGNITVTGYDRDGRRNLITYPTYTAPGTATPITPSETFTYDANGNLITQLDRRGKTWSYEFDRLNRNVWKIDPLLTGQTVSAETQTSYDDSGHVIKTVNQIGAINEAVYDDLGRVRYQKETVRPIGAGTTQVNTTTVQYDPAGRMIWKQQPDGQTVTQTWSPAGEMLTSVAPPTVSDTIAETTVMTYDVAGRVVKIRDPLGREDRAYYDVAGRKVGADHYDRLGTKMFGQSSTYDQNSNVITNTSARGFVTTYTYDVLNRLTGVNQPVDASTGNNVITSFGYDANSQQTRTTDGKAKMWATVYNPWNLVESRIEPSTTGQTATTDRTFTTGYDAGGLPVKVILPGTGISIDRTFNETGKLTKETGVGVYGSRTLTYDKAGRLATAGHPSGTAVSLTWNDRNQIATVAGGAGASSFTYDASGRMTNRTDASGAQNFTWTTRNELRTASDALTGATRTYTWNQVSQLSGVGYGTGNGTRTLGFDDANRLTSDVLSSSTGTQTYSQSYGYDVGGNVVSSTVGPVGVAGAGVHSYSYDQADRLVSWQSPSASTVYGYDRNGNRVQAGSQTFVFDDRNRVMSDGVSVYAWSPRGTLNSKTTGSTVVSSGFDVFGRVTTQGATSFTYDALDRLASRGGVAFGYSGLLSDPTSDGVSTYARSVGGDVLAERTGGVSLLVEQNRHGDVSMLFNSQGVLAATKFFDPFGNKTASTGSTSVSVGFQGDYTDPVSGDVWMGARWYSPGTDSFTSRDSFDGVAKSPVSLNRYTYGNDNPLSFYDPDGHYGRMVDGGWSRAGYVRSGGSGGLSRSRSRADGGFLSWSSDFREKSVPRADMSGYGKYAGLMHQSVVDQHSADEARAAAYVKANYGLFDKALHPGNGTDGYICKGDFKAVADHPEKYGDDAVRVAKYALEHDMVHRLGGDEPGWLERTAKSLAGPIMGLLVGIGCMATVGVAASVAFGPAGTVGASAVCAGAGGAVARGTATLVNGGSVKGAIYAAGDPKANAIDFGLGLITGGLIEGGSAIAQARAANQIAAETTTLATEAERLAGRVDDFHGALDPIAQNSRTTSVMSTQEGVDIISSGGRDLSPAQRALAQDGDVLGRLPGAHAEVTSLDAATKAGLSPSQIAVSRPICAGCQTAIQNSGGQILPGGMGAMWPR